MKKMLCVADLAAEHHLEILYTPKDLSELFIEDKNIDRIGMQLMGFYPVHHPERFHMMGLQEASYLATLDEVSRASAINGFFEAGTAGLIVSHDAYCDPQILTAAQEYNKPVLRTPLSPSEYIHDFYYFAAKYFAPSTIMHGGLVEVHGEGILILGDSGIGKSETAIQLVKDGHRLIADDSVEIKRTPEGTLQGSSLPLTYGFVELRGVGIINIQTLYGTAAVQNKIKITSAMHFVPWKPNENYERLGLEQEYKEILGIKLPLATVPVRPGRNLASIVEVYAINQRAKRDGYNAAEQLNTQLINQMEKQ